ncbi:Glycosyl phosphatidyl inositol anchor synthesis, variant 2 [Batrachochytrium dendrobatidis]
MQPVARLLIIGVIFHAIYTWSIFDIYFRSPLVHGMEHVEPLTPAPAKRLLLLVADGLRADKLFEDGMKRAPFLKTKITEEGRWGISHTRVPTESRPGHVALIAGFYEDVSAVTKGWKTNPVNFDSVFNQSRHTWSFGSPDILPMFAFGASEHSRVDTYMYSAEHEDFGKDDASSLDTWVFDHFDALLESSKTNSTLFELLHSDKIVFFLHLLGLDTSGHSHRPNSPEYYANIELVDKGIQVVENKLKAFYNDDKRTATVFTADHGMGNRGVHGDGHPDNTETPLIAWGAGIATPDTKHPKGNDAVSKHWGFGHLQRNDVLQADIAPLMSTLLGISFPVNSVGVLPIVYLDGTDMFKAKAAFGNAKGILSQYIVKTAQKRTTELIFKPFKPLAQYQDIVSKIQALIDLEKFEEAERESIRLIQVCIDGLRYYQTYDWLFLRSIISFGYVGWIVYSTIFVLRMYVLEDSKRSRGISISSKTVTFLSWVVLTGFSVLLFLKQSPLAYYIYVAFPIYFWSESFKQRDLVTSIIRTPWSQNRTNVLGHIIVYTVILEILVYTYFRREVLSICLIAVGIVWPIMMPAGFKKRHGKLVLAWRIASICTSVFTLLPVEVEQDIRLVLLGGALVFLSGVAALNLIPQYTAVQLPTPHMRASGVQPSSLKIVTVLLTILGISFAILVSTTRSLDAKQGLPIVNSIISWLIMIPCVAIPIVDGALGSQHYLRRLVVIYLSFAPLFTLLSISYEVLFFFFFSITILSWMLLEKQLYFFENKIYQGTMYAEIVQSETTIKHRPLRMTDMRIAGFFLLFINVAFFGTGNIASLSSFSLESVYRFTTVFNPFLMAALLVLKILIPFFLLSSVFAILSRVLDLSSFSLFLLVLSTTDIMTLNFFFLVRDDGSWLEIGTTISHFIIASAFIVFQIILFSVSHLLVGNVLIPHGVNSKKGY